MRPLQLAALAVIIAACGPAQEEPAPPPSPAPPARSDTSFDAAAWMQRAAAVWDTTLWATAPDSATAASLRFATELNRALPWLDACDLPPDAASDSTSRTGIMNRYVLGPDEYVVSISCQLFANQATFVVVHVDSSAALLVQAPQFDESGAPADTSSLFIGNERVDREQRTLTVFTRARGAGDCGTQATYRIRRRGTIEVLSVRARECIDVLEGDVEVPEQWPVVYPRS